VTRLSFAATLLSLLATLLSASPSQAIEPSETILPATTKGFFSVPDLKALEDNWDKTQLGTLLQDPLMKPFIEDLEAQIRKNGSGRLAKLGLTWKNCKACQAAKSP